VRFRMLIDGTCVVAYVNDKTALSCRMYDHRAGKLGLFVNEGQAHFSRVIVKRCERPDCQE
jgi:beta-fructofuranosidase